VEVAIASRTTSANQQVNFTLDPHWRLVLRIVAEADGVSVPDLLRPVVIRYLRRRMRDEDLQEAVARIENVRRTRSLMPDNITPLPAPRPGPGGRSPGRPQAKGTSSKSRSRRAQDEK
jgi:hypothetical protein